MPKRKVDPTKVQGVLKDRMTTNGKRRLKLTADECAALKRQELATTAAYLFLDLDTPRSLSEIAREMDMSIYQVREITKTEEFEIAYNDLFLELGKDPRYKAAQGALADMLPIAMGQLRDILTNPRTPAGTRLKAVEKIMNLNGLENIAPQQSNRQELVEYLVENNINIDAVNIALPDIYQEQMDDVIEAEFDIEKAQEAPSPQLPEGEQDNPEE